MNKLYVVSTPIGNIKDITERAKETLQNVNVVLAEDTRNTEKLFSLIGIKNKIISLHKWNENEKTETVLKYLEEGEVALVSDAGTPTISDPGQFLISSLMEKGVEIVSVPGASALIAALSISGIKYKSFSFIGFLPKKENQLIELIEENNSDVLIGYESPNRIKKTLETLEKNNNSLNVTIAREITKKFEEVLKGKPSELKGKDYKGEIVIMIETPKQEDDKLKEKVSLMKEMKLSNKDIITYLTKYDGYKKNDIYEELKDE